MILYNPMCVQPHFIRILVVLYSLTIHYAISSPYISKLEMPHELFVREMWLSLHAYIIYILHYTSLSPIQPLDLPTPAQKTTRLFFVKL